MNTIVEAKRVKKVYGAKGQTYTALREFDLTVAQGEFVGIMGPSGAGKTTLLQLLATIDRPTSGHIVIDGVDVSAMKEAQLSDFRRDKLGFLFQDYHLLDMLTVKENIMLPLALARRQADELERRVDQIADTFGLRPFLNHYPAQLSGGQKQRTAAARAIVARPSLVLADEPTGALDSKSATDLLESLKELHEAERTTIVMVTHDAFAASYCERIVFIKDGEAFAELVKGRMARQPFFRKVLDMLSVLGGGAGDIV
ncbi:ABC transporter ATP-binding protein [Paenibacillus cymbidii]|uniref:ABC transporter ATP-binding protein n=1 Tax=Paenibacillus cymbidii TaxID=1639034 RepID=UPI0010806BB7|nr:ABC transporter ATP-binding protein [Paenibacillus cymbidii]